MHQQRRQARVLVRDFDVLDTRIADDSDRLAEDRDGFLVDLHPARRLRLQEALAGLVVARRALETGRGGEQMAVLLGGAAARLDLVAHAGPFLEPGIVVADLVAQGEADAVHLVDLGAAPRRAAQANEQSHRPAIVVGEIEKGRIALVVGHNMPRRNKVKAAAGWSGTQVRGASQGVCSSGGAAQCLLRRRSRCHGLPAIRNSSPKVRQFASAGGTLAARSRGAESRQPGTSLLPAAQEFQARTLVRSPALQPDPS